MGMYMCVCVFRERSWGAWGDGLKTTASVWITSSLSVAVVPASTVRYKTNYTRAHKTLKQCMANNLKHFNTYTKLLLIPCKTQFSEVEIQLQTSHHNVLSTRHTLGRASAIVVPGRH